MSTKKHNEALGLRKKYGSTIYLHYGKLKPTA
jgi:hypothetical protein